jgi:hypothetical protein
MRAAFWTAVGIGMTLAISFGCGDGLMKDESPAKNDKLFSGGDDAVSSAPSSSTFTWTTTSAWTSTQTAATSDTMSATATDTTTEALKKIDPAMVKGKVQVIAMQMGSAGFADYYIANLDVASRSLTGLSKLDMFFWTDGGYASLPDENMHWVLESSRLRKVDGAVGELVPVGGTTPERMAAMTVDTKRQRVVAIDYYGQGTMWAIPLAGGSWASVGTLDGIDYTAITYDATADEIVGVGASGLDRKVVRLNPETGATVSSAVLSEAIGPQYASAIELQLRFTPQGLIAVEQTDLDGAIQTKMHKIDPATGAVSDL